jgi:UDP-N-acetylglucosamine 2-epimerase (non-hydrolysing)/GDP/UDP-N,N'-diacetylbacillosamine 2-epimerase (hydrolysing)
VVDIGARQLGRERSANVVNVPYSAAAITRAVRRAIRDPRPFKAQRLWRSGNKPRASQGVLAAIRLDDRMRRKLIVY